ncbi:MAG: class A beta-lactamase [Sphingomonas sp.]
MLVTAAALTPLAALIGGAALAAPGVTAVRDRLRALEAKAGGRLGVAAVRTRDGARVDYRANERFAFCSTFKGIAVPAVLKRSETERGLLDRRIAYGKDKLVTYSPVTEKHVGTGMTVAELCAAAIQYSDNTAANLIIELLGGPAAVTRFARSIGDTVFRLDRIETALNTAIPGDPRDTTTPAAMTRDLQRLALGDLLGKPQRAQLIEWLAGNTTGDKRIRAAVPGWRVADKTGTGEYGTTNDIAVVWPPKGSPIVMTIYFTQSKPDASARDNVVADAARIVVAALG